MKAFSRRISHMCTGLKSPGTAATDATAASDAGFADKKTETTAKACGTSSGGYDTADMPVVTRVTEVIYNHIKIPLQEILPDFLSVLSVCLNPGLQNFTCFFRFRIENSAGI